MILTPIPPADWSLPAGQQYADWLDVVRERNPLVSADNPDGEPPIPDEGYPMIDGNCPLKVGAK